MSAKPKSKSSGPSAAKKTVKSSQNMILRMLFGNVVTIEFFKRHWIQIFILIVLVMIYISNKYQCMTSMEEIKRLQQELEIVKTERVRERSTYMSRIRETSMQELVDTLIPGLRVPDQPTYELKRTSPDNEN